MTDADVGVVIEQDHRELGRLFGQLRDPASDRPQLTNHLTMLLTAHSRAEEAEVYPVAAEAGDADAVARNIDEHLELDRLLAELGSTEPTSAAFDSLLDGLAQAVRHHIEEEESTLLRHLKQRLSEPRRQEVGGAFLAARARYLDQQPEESGHAGRYLDR